MMQLFFLAWLLFSNVHATDHLVWSGIVHSDGTPTTPVKLELHQEYYIKVSGFVNLGKWVQGGEKLANDACYEFNREKSTSKVESLRNSNDITVCEGEYHANHIYQSAPFTAKQDRIHFWVQDTTYEDNSGNFKVEIFKAANSAKK